MRTKTVIVRPKRLRWMGALAIVLVTSAAYGPIFHAGFVWDDDSFLTRNPLLSGAHALRRIWLAGQGADYWPLTSTFMWVQWRLWGLQALGYHATNLALHLAETLLLWRILRRLRLPGAWLGAMIFAVHPVNVESVAWITQAKNLVATLFSLLAVLAYLRAEGLESPAGKRETWHGLSLLCFALAMLGKASVAGLPLILAGLTAWHRPLGRRDGLRLIPFLLVAALLAVVTKAYEARAAAGVLMDRGWLERLLGAGTAIWFYLSKAVAPAHLAFVYPLWNIQTAAVAGWTPLLAAAAVTIVLWRGRKTWSRPLLFAWGYFCVALLPVLGFVDFYFMRYSLVADHYEHLALIGAAAVAAWALESWRLTSLGRVAAPMVAVVAVALLAAMSWRQCQSLADAETLYRTTLRENPSCWLAYNNLGILAADRGQAPEARDDFRQAMAAGPGAADPHFNYGAALERAGRRSEAAAQYEMALRLQPSFRPARLPLAEFLADSGHFREAAIQYRLAFERPATPDLHCQLADYLRAQGRSADARAEYREALRLDAHDRAAQDGLRELSGAPSR